MGDAPEEPTRESPATDDAPTTDHIDPRAVLKLIRGALELLPLLAPFALLAGWLTVAAYARSLGLQPGDLDLGITEILVLASINLSLGLLLSVGLSFLHSGWRKRYVVGLALITGSGTLLYSSLSYRGAAIGVLLAGTSAVMTWLVRRFNRNDSPPSDGRPMTPREFVSGLAVLGMVPLVLIGLQMSAAHSGGSAIGRGEPADLPLALTMTLPADKGMLDGECVIRVARRVFVNPVTGVVVLSGDPDTFTLGCESD